MRRDEAETKQDKARQNTTRQNTTSQPCPAEEGDDAKVGDSTGDRVVFRIPKNRLEDKS